MGFTHLFNHLKLDTDRTSDCGDIIFMSLMFIKLLTLSVQLISFAMSP